MNILNETVIKINNEKVLVSELGDEMVMMHLERGNYITINNIGKIIWEKIQEPVTVNELINYLVSRFDVEMDQCKSQTFSFLEKLEEEELILLQ